MADDLGVLLREAMRARRLVEFDLQGLHRVGEPHVYGRHNGVEQLQFFQIEGESRSGKLPHWRRASLAEMSGFRLLERTFSPRALGEGKPGGWDEVFETV